MGIAALALLLVMGRASIESPRGESHEDAALAVLAEEESRAPKLVDTVPTAIAYPMPGKPFSDQAKVPCKTKLHQVEINGGCWLELANTSTLRGGLR